MCVAEDKVYDVLGLDIVCSHTHESIQSRLSDQPQNPGLKIFSTPREINHEHKRFVLLIHHSHFRIYFRQPKNLFLSTFILITVLTRIQPSTVSNINWI